MPYKGEFAGYKPLARIANSDRVQSIVRRCKKRVSDGEQVDVKPLIADVKPSGWLPDLLLAVDGSYHQLPVENGYPGAELAYITVASVILDVKKQRELDRSRPVNPLASRRTEEPGSIDCALPGCNVVVDSEPTPKASFRRVFFESILEKRPLSDGETLLETYEALLAYKPSERPQQCPYDDCPTDATYAPSSGDTHCKCEQQRIWYSTDALRIHEGLNPNGSSGAMFAEAMQVWERVWAVNFLRWIERKPRRFRLLRNLGIVLDGPLAVFGHPAWLSRAIYQELKRINGAARQVIGKDLLLVGVEKSGAFVDHYEVLDAPVSRVNGKRRFEPQTAVLLTNEYIRNHIALGDKPFGQDTYFGRKLFYKTASGARIVASLPFLTDASRDLSRRDPSHFPRLADAMSLLDATFSARFPNAVSPLISAHAEAAIPLNLGREVLEQLAKSLMAEEET
ncbi:DNA double-strand break repair nuclease NurA [Synechococcus sp. PCC 7336]|uniref:DNA double-strand break repair nuclease NurA n=1 Tax=Synechococcus sp. PCC 7336 TaxID=195250 RepID=UPI00034953A6|nr:DNA double-strand break repair nuclease NurA [Synechococcus sp. PCC 7336]